MLRRRSCNCWRGSDVSKQLSIGTKTAAPYINYLAHVPCYQDGTESVTQALDTSGKGNHLNFCSGLNEGAAWATPGQLAIAYSASVDGAVKLPASVANTIDFDAGDHFIFAAECQITNPAATTRILAQGQSATRCGLRFSMKTTGVIAPSIWTPSGQVTGTDSAALGEASPTTWSQFLLYIGAKNLDGAGIIRYLQCVRGVADATVFRTISSVGLMNSLRLDDLYVGGYFEFAVGQSLAAKWRNIHLIRIQAAVDVPFLRVARLASRLARSPNLPVTAQELGL